MFMWFQAKAYPDPYYLNDKYQKAWEEAQSIRKNQYAYRLNSATWNSIGPSQTIGGRILCVAIDPNNSNKLFAGSASGGIWKSSNAGSSWQSVNTGFFVLGVSSIIINPSNSNIIYAGSGEVYRIDSTSGTPNPGNTGFNVWKTRGTYGVGILKSSDGGVTWSQVLNRIMPNMFGIQMLEFDPTNSNTVYACATDGLYRTTNSGTSWNKILNKTYVSDVVINAKNTNEIVAAVGNLGNTDKGVYRSTDGGTNWTKITTGLPASFNGFIRFDNVPTIGNRDTIIASIGVSKTSTTELYRSTNFGSSWASLSTSGHTSYQYWCAHDVAIRPTHTDSIMMGGVPLYRYLISTSSRSSSISNVHSDIHDIEYDPSNSNKVYVTCDGGIYKSTNGGGTFSSINSGLAATQF